MSMHVSIETGSGPPPGYTLPVELTGPPKARPSQVHPSTGNYPGSSLGVLTGPNGQPRLDLSTTPAMSAHSSQTLTVPDSNITVRSPESVDGDAWGREYEYYERMPYDDYKDVPISHVQSNTPEEFDFLSQPPSDIPPDSPRGGLRQRADDPQGYLPNVADEDSTGNYSEDRPRSSRKKKRESAKHVSGRRRNGGTRDGGTPYQTAGNNELSDDGRGEESQVRSSTSSGVDSARVQEAQLPIRSTCDTPTNPRPESELPYERRKSHKNRSRKSSKAERSRRKSKKSKSKRSKSKRSKSKRSKSKHKKRRQPSPTPSEPSAISSGSIRSITPPHQTMITKLCHPIVFNHEDSTIPCSLCSLQYAILGLGPRTVILHDRGHGAGLEEITPSALETTKICVPCTASRMRILICRQHKLQAIDDAAITPTGFGEAFQRVLDGSPLHTDMWCSVCPSPALYKCVGSREMEEEHGCGLLLCEPCAVGLHQGAKGWLEKFLKAVGEGGDERPLGLRADAELLSMEGPLARFMIRMAGEDWDE